MTGLDLKIIATVTMLIDHIGHVLFPGNIWLRIVGRIALPIYCFLLVEGFLHTRDLRRYMFRLLIFGIISEIPFDLAFYNKIFTIKHQNVFWTLLFGLMAISVMSMIRHENIYISFFLRVLAAVPFGVTAQLLHTDYRWVGVGLIASMYLFHDFELLKVASGAVFMLPFFTNEIEFAGYAAFIPMHFYKGRSGMIRGVPGRVLQFAFYVFYPLHLIVLIYIRDRIWMY